MWAKHGKKVRGRQLKVPALPNRFFCHLQTTCGPLCDEVYIADEKTDPVEKKLLFWLFSLTHGTVFTSVFFSFFSFFFLLLAIFQILTREDHQNSKNS